MTITDFLPSFLVSLAAGGTLYGFQKLTGKDPIRELADRLSLPQPAHTPGDIIEKVGNNLLPVPPEEGPPLPRGLNIQWPGKK